MTGKEKVAEGKRKGGGEVDSDKQLIQGQQLSKAGRPSITPTDRTVTVINRHPAQEVSRNETSCTYEDHSESSRTDTQLGKRY